MLLEVYVHWNFEYLCLAEYICKALLLKYLFFRVFPLFTRSFSVDFLSDVFEFYEIVLNFTTDLSVMCAYD